MAFFDEYHGSDKQAARFAKTGASHLGKNTRQ